MPDALRYATAIDVDENGADRSDLPITLPLEIVVQNAETIAELCAHPEGESRDRFALEALRIGVLALKSARGQLDADLVRRESDRLMQMLDGKLQQHSDAIHHQTTSTLAKYFDPKSGHFQERVERLIKRDGELELLLRRQVGENDSELCKALSAHIGEESPLLKQLSPDESKGVLAALRLTLEEQLKTQREQVLGEFSLDNKEGALSRLIGELTDQNGEITKELQEKIDRLMKEFSLNEDESALTKLVNRVQEAQKTITREFSLDDRKSALSRFKEELLDLHERQRKVNQEFQEEVKVTLAKMVARKEEAERSTQHGLAFEDAVFEFVQREAQKAVDVATHTGNTTGSKRNCKVGDATVDLGPDSAAPGARYVVEAKEKANYALTEATSEIETARKNREAQVGLFVFSSKTCPQNMEWLQRFGNDVVVVWDAEDATSDVYLTAGISLARALCVRQHRQSEETNADFKEIDRAILEIEKKAGALEQIHKWATTIQNNSENILDKVRIMKNGIEKQIEELREHTNAVKSAIESASAD